MRSVEEMQAGLRTAMNEIQSIKDDLEQFKNAKSNGDLTADFKKISANAKRYPITPHPLSDTDEHTQKLYLTLLLSVAAYEPERLSDSLYFIHRIAYGCGYLEKGDLKEEFTSAQILTFDQLDEATGLFRENDLRLMLIEEMLITAGAFNKGRNAAFEYISRMCQLLNVNKDKISFLSNMAAVVLTKDASNYKCSYLNTYPMFDVYLVDIEFPMEIYNVSFPSEMKAKSLSTREFYTPISSIDIDVSMENHLVHVKGEYRGGISYTTYDTNFDIGSSKKFVLKRTNITTRDALNTGEKMYSASIGVLASLLCPSHYPPAYYFFEKNKLR